MGARSVFEWTQPGAEPAPAIVLEQPTAGRTELRSDVLADLRTIGDACASAWSIDLATSGGSIKLEDFGGAPGDEGYGTQNRFALDLGRYRGDDYDLHVNLTFPGVTMESTWPIRILPFDPPTAQLTWYDHRIDVEPGCDLQLTLGTGYTELVDACYADLRRLPEPAVISRGGSIDFSFPAGWHAELGMVTCGLISEARFQPDPSCETGWDAKDAAVTITGPSKGTWTLAMSGCATQLLADVSNQTCGTWYATIQVRPSGG